MAQRQQFIEFPVTGFGQFYFFQACGVQMLDLCHVGLRWAAFVALQRLICALAQGAELLDPGIGAG